MQKFIKVKKLSTAHRSLANIHSLSFNSDGSFATACIYIWFVRFCGGLYDIVTIEKCTKCRILASHGIPGTRAALLINDL
jgi:hypothetical protein